MATDYWFTAGIGGYLEKLSVIVTTISDAIATNLTIAQILAQLEADNFDYEIIVVDNGSDAENKQNLNSFLDFHKDFPIKYFEYDIKGTIPPHAFGVTQATGEYITMPDPHIILSPHYFKVMVDSLKKLQAVGCEVVFSPFSVGSIAKRGGDYISASELIYPNPFNKVGRIGESCKFGDPAHPILSDTISGMVCTREWFLHIGNMFPEAFKFAGGHTAEGLMVGIPTWLMGKKCYAEPHAIFDHPVYRRSHGVGRSANMFSSMAIGAYIIGGADFLKDMPNQYGEYVPGELESIPALADYAREYLLANSKYTIKELMDNWSKIRYE